VIRVDLGRIEESFTVLNGKAGTVRRKSLAAVKIAGGQVGNER
jgi:hypothetical protein